MEAKRRIVGKPSVLPAAAAAVMVLAGFTSRILAQYDQPLNVVVPQSRAYGFTTAQQAAVRITEVEAEIHIVEKIATTCLQIELENTTGSIQAATLMLPVPRKAVVTSFAYVGPGWEIPAVILPERIANYIYNRLVSAIRDPALVEFVGTDLLMTRVFPIEPAGTRTLVLTYEHILEAENNRVDYYLPRTESLQYAVPWKLTANIMWIRVDPHPFHARVKLKPAEGRQFVLPHQQD